MLAPNDARITGLRCVEAETGSAAGVIMAGSPLDVLMSVEAGASLFATGARFAAGVQVEGAGTTRSELLEARLGDVEWPLAAAELRFRLSGEVTADLADWLLGVAGFMRVNAAPPFLVSVARGPDVYVAPR